MLDAFDYRLHRIEAARLTGPPQPQRERRWSGSVRLSESAATSRCKKPRRGQRPRQTIRSSAPRPSSQPGSTARRTGRSTRCFPDGTSDFAVDCRFALAFEEVAFGGLSGAAKKRRRAVARRRVLSWVLARGNEPNPTRWYVHTFNETSRVLRTSVASSRVTHRWREMNSNFRFRD